MWSLIGTVFSWIVGLFTKSTRDDEVALGKAQQQVSDGKGTIAAQERVAKAAAEPSGRDVTEKALKEGEF